MYTKHVYDQQFEIYYVNSTLISVVYMNKIYTFLLSASVSAATIELSIQWYGAYVCYIYTYMHTDHVYVTSDWT